MKKCFLTGAALLVLGGLFTGCSHDDIDYSSVVDSKLKAFQDVFVDAYGTIDPNQTWGFTTNINSGDAAARAFALTRAAMPAAPTFRDTNPIEKPSVPSTYQNTVPQDAKYAKDYQNYQNGDVLYINTAYSSLNNPQNFSDLTIYVDGTVTYAGQTNQNGNGTVFCVTENSTLKLGAVSNNLTVYLAPGATLDLTKAYYEDWSTGQRTYVENGNGSFSFQNPHAAILMSAGSTVKAYDLSLTGGAKMLNKGGSIEAHNLTLDQNSTLWNDGALTVSNTLTVTNTSSAVYNAAGKTITAQKIDLINNDCLIYNDGTVTVTDDIVLHNSVAEFINNGTMTAASYSQAAGGKTHNVGTATFTGKTDLTNANSQWQNDGQWTCGSFDVDNYSAVNFNNCRLTVNGNYHQNRGTFVLNSNASVVCQSFTWENTSDFYLNSKSMVKCAGTLLTRNYDQNYGFRGVGTDYAVIQASAIAHEGNEQFRMSYYGNLYIDTPSHFGQWYKDAPNTQQPAYYYENTVKFSFTDDADKNVVASAAPVTIPASECSPGYGSITIPVDQSETTEEMITVVTTKEHYKTTQLIEQGRVFCEDLGQISTNDFDFNDVVFDAYVYRTATSTRTLVREDGVTTIDKIEEDTPTYHTTIVLLAAGGTLQLSLAGMEVHNVLGGNPTSTIINTITSGDEAYNNVYFTNDPIVLGTDFTYTNIADIPIRVLYGNGETLELTAASGWAPHKILVPIGTKWCKERVDIATAYTDFHNYVSSSQNFWEGNIDTSKLYYHPKDTYKPITTLTTKTLISTEGPTTTYRKKGSSTSGGYQGEEVLSRKAF